MSKHTPGPWRTARLARHGHPIRVLAEDATVAIVPEDDTLETRTGRIVEFVSPTGEANARLIASAPELLAALEMMTPAPGFPKCDRLCSSMGAAFDEDPRCDCGFEEIRENAEKARAAIAKATGEKP